MIEQNIKTLDGQENRLFIGQEISCMKIKVSSNQIKQYFGNISLFTTFKVNLDFKSKLLISNVNICPSENLPEFCCSRSAISSQVED